MEEGDSDPVRFLSYLIAAFQTLEPGIGENALATLQPHQPLQVESVLTTLLNEIAALPDIFYLMLDALERSNLFIILLDDKCQWYRYHHLFADVLQAHLLESVCKI